MSMQDIVGFIIVIVIVVFIVILCLYGERIKDIKLQDPFVKKIKKINYRIKLYKWKYEKTKKPKAKKKYLERIKKLKDKKKELYDNVKRKREKQQNQKREIKRIYER